MACRTGASPPRSPKVANENSAQTIRPKRNADPVLSRPTFGKNKNNFWMYFFPQDEDGGMFWPAYGGSPFMQECLKKEPALRVLYAELSNLPQEELEEPDAVVLTKLYEAYRLMQPYAESNRQLFS